MKKYIFTSVFVIMIFLFVCCKRNDNIKEISSFPTTSSLRVQHKLTIDSALITYPVMKIDGNYCCIADMAAKVNFFHLYTFPSFKYIKSFGALGHGSNELAMLTSFDFRNGVVSALCGAERTIKLFNIRNPSSPKIIRPKEIVDYSAICDGDDNSYYLYSLNGRNRVHRIDTCGKIISQGLKAEVLKKEYPRMTSNYIWQGQIRQYGSYVVVPTACGDIIDITTPEFKTYLRLKGQLGEPRVKERATTNSKSYMLQYQTYIDVVLAKQIYALFLCEDLSKYPNGKERNSIRVYDYYGNPQKELLLEDNLEPSSFYVDENSRKFYVMVPESEKPIWVYEL